MPFSPLPTILLNELKQLTRQQGAYGLDLGCGDGQLARDLREDGIPLWGLDRISRRLGVFPDLVGDALALPLAQQHVDLLLASNLVRHLLSADPEAKFLAHWLTALRPGGSIFILEDKPDHSTAARRNYLELQKLLAFLDGSQRGPLLEFENFLPLVQKHVPSGLMQGGTCPNNKKPDVRPILEFLVGKGKVPGGKIGALVGSLERFGLDYGDYWWLRITRERR